MYAIHCLHYVMYLSPIILYRMAKHPYSLPPGRAMWKLFNFYCNKKLMSNFVTEYVPDSSVVSIFFVWNSACGILLVFIACSISVLESVTLHRCRHMKYNNALPHSAQ